MIFKCKTCDTQVERYRVKDTGFNCFPCKRKFNKIKAYKYRLIKKEAEKTLKTVTKRKYITKEEKYKLKIK